MIFNYSKKPYLKPTMFHNGLNLNKVLYTAQSIQTTCITTCQPHADLQQDKSYRNSIFTRKQFCGYLVIIRILIGSSNIEVQPIASMETHSEGAHSRGRTRIFSSQSRGWSLTLNTSFLTPIAQLTSAVHQVKCVTIGT